MPILSYVDVSDFRLVCLNPGNSERKKGWKKYVYVVTVTASIDHATQPWLLGLEKNADLGQSIVPHSMIWIFHGRYIYSRSSTK